MACEYFNHCLGSVAELLALHATWHLQCPYLPGVASLGECSHSLTVASVAVVPPSLCLTPHLPPLPPLLPLLPPLPALPPLPLPHSTATVSVRYHPCAALAENCKRRLVPHADTGSANDRVPPCAASGRCLVTIASCSLRFDGEGASECQQAMNNMNFLEASCCSWRDPCLKVLVFAWLYCILSLNFVGNFVSCLACLRLAGCLDARGLLGITASTTGGRRAERARVGQRALCK